MTQVYPGLRRNATVPLYVQIRDRLVDDIEHGRLRPGDRIPSEPALVERFRVGRPTVRQALSLLRSEGWATTRKGAGTFVATAQPQVSLMDFGGLTRSVAARGFRVHDEVLDTGTSDHVELDVLAADGPHAWWWVERLRRVDDGSSDERHPLCIERDSFALDACPSAQAVFEETGSATSVLDVGSIVDVTACESATRAVAADRRTARLLEVERGAPLLAMERVNKAVDGSVVHVVRYTLRTDRVPVVDASTNPSFGRPA